MNKTKRVLLLSTALLTAVGLPFQSYARTVHRKISKPIPQIDARWINSDTSYTIKDVRLRKAPFFESFDARYLFNNYLPNGPITFRNDPTSAIRGVLLNQHVEGLIDEVYARKKEFNDFLVITDRNFNHKRPCGILILKHKHSPFIVKLFIEEPKTFVNPYCKGFEPIFLFRLSGGVNRHLSGFSRIKNGKTIKKTITNNEWLAAYVDTPRKWFWVSNRHPWIELTGTNFEPNKVLRATIPGVYAIIVDAINPTHLFSLWSKEDREKALKIYNNVGSNLDPHIDNFMIEKETGKVIIVDTEHFHSIVGPIGNVKFNSYFGVYSFLIGKCLHDTLF